MANLQHTMPGPEDDTVRCIVRRDSTKSIFKLCVGVGNATKGIDEGKFLLAARKVKRALCTEYIITSSAEADISSRDGSNIVGKLRSNFRNTRYTVYNSELPHKEGVFSSCVTSGWHTSSDKISRRVPAGYHKVAHVAYDGFLDCPANMQCTLDTIPASVMDPDVFARTSTEILPVTPDDPIPFCGLVRSKKSKSAVADDSGTADLNGSITGGRLNEGRHLVLRNKAPYIKQERPCLNLKGHGNMLASRRNFQLVAATDPNAKSRWTTNIDNVLLQVAKIGEHSFTVHYRYPLPCFQAFAIFLSVVDCKVFFTFRGTVDSLWLTNPQFRRDRAPPASIPNFSPPHDPPTLWSNKLGRIWN